jgi:uncharacterized protein involved in oxidation of intracellular sulfur
LAREGLEDRAHARQVSVKILLILNDPPYGTERTYNGLRLALAILKSDPTAQVTVFLMADAVVAARSGQKTPDGYYNIERMLRRVLAGKGRVLLCSTHGRARTHRQQADRGAISAARWMNCRGNPCCEKVWCSERCARLPRLQRQYAPRASVVGRCAPSRTAGNPSSPHWAGAPEGHRERSPPGRTLLGCQPQERVHMAARATMRQSRTVLCTHPRTAHHHDREHPSVLSAVVHGLARA